MFKSLSAHAWAGTRQCPPNNEGRAGRRRGEPHGRLLMAVTGGSSISSSQMSALTGTDSGLDLGQPVELPRNESDPV